MHRAPHQGIARASPAEGITPMSQMTSPVTVDRYAQNTASMLADPEAHLTEDAVFESFHHPFPIAEARCATTCEEWEWVPTREDAVVPEPMTQLCKRCPGRSDCLIWALAGSEVGYWAGTTTAQRAIMRTQNRRQVHDADQIRDSDLAASTVPPTHPVGRGSLEMYRKGKCRCIECRGFNAASKAKERTRARDHHQGKNAA